MFSLALRIGDEEKWYTDNTYSTYVPGIMTLSLKDAETHMVYNSIPLTHELRFYELERIKKITDPSIKNQINN